MKLLQHRYMPVALAAIAIAMLFVHQELGILLLCVAGGILVYIAFRQRIAITVTPRSVAFIALAVVGTVQPWWNWLSLDGSDASFLSFIAVSFFMFALSLGIMIYHLRKARGAAGGTVSPRKQTYLVAWIIGAIAADMIVPPSYYFVGDCILLLIMLGIWLFAAPKTNPYRPIYIAALGCGIVAELLLNAAAPVIGLTNLMS